jgi:hypothetical protein
MTTRAIKGVLQAAILGGAVGLLPAAARAGDTSRGAETATPDVPDHAEAEARRGSEANVPTTEKSPGPPDHAQAEARGGAARVVPTDEEKPGAPDHAQAEARGAD